MEVPLRKLALFVFAFACFATAAFAQQGDVFIGGGTVTSSNNASLNLPAEKGGLYIHLGGDIVFHNRFGASVETMWRATQGVYVYDELNYRPVLTTFNLLYQPRLGKRIGADLTAGIGPASTRFYEPGTLSESGYSNYESTDHFMEHIGGGIRFYAWKHLFVRPEVDYFHIQNNNSTVNNGFFGSNNLVHIGASIGYTIGGGD
jgi:hypothetical protein